MRIAGEAPEYVKISENVNIGVYMGNGHMRTDDMTMCMRNTCDLK